MRGVRGGIGRVAGSALAVLAGVTAMHLAAQLRGVGAIADATQVMLMPLLLLALLAGTAPPRGRLAGLFALGLGLSWMGDSLPRLLDGQLRFLVMLGSFLLAQIVYAAALWPLRRDSLLGRGEAASRSAVRRGSAGRAVVGGAVVRGDAASGGTARRAAVRRAAVRRAALLPYLGAAVVIVGLCAPAAGPLLPALVVYASALCTMAVLATGLGMRGVIGGALFVISDALIALDTFGMLALPAHSFWVMLTYVPAQVLLVLGVLDRHARDGGRPRDEPWSSGGAGRPSTPI